VVGDEQKTLPTLEKHIEREYPESIRKNFSGHLSIELQTDREGDET
jgi:hypothetical protein